MKVRISILSFGRRRARDVGPAGGAGIGARTALSARLGGLELTRGHSCPRSDGSVRRRACSEAAFFLVDALIYIALLGLIMGFAFSAFFKCLSASRDLKRNAENIVTVLQAGERWRADIRGAIEAPKIVVQGADNALEIPTASGLTVYLFHNGTVWRRQQDEVPWEAVLLNVKNSVMNRDVRRHVAAWSWEIELKSRKQIVRVPPVFSFVAVAASDLIP